jgi:serine/threonine protein kinase
METKKDIILVIEYAAGGELLNYIIAHGRVKEPEAKKFVRQIVDALVITDYDQGLMCIELLSFNARGTSRFKSREFSVGRRAEYQDYRFWLIKCF